ncbi:MAG: ABC transporter permease, partial [Bdellovibrionota bacterium]
MSRKKQTLLILLGISFGTLLFVSISGLQLGMRQYMAERLLNNTAHVLISGAERMIEPAEVTEALYGKDPAIRWLLAPYGKREESRLENYQGWYQRLSQDPEVLDFSPRLTTNAILTNGNFSSSVNLTGTVPERQLRISSIAQYVTEGSFSALSGGSSNIVIGSGVAKDLGARLDQYINVSSGRNVQRPFKIVGIVHFGSDQ